MKKSKCLMTFIIFLALGAYGRTTAAQEICSAPLNEALKTVRESTTYDVGSEAETAWQCSFNFSSHDEAISFGLDVGTEIYGIPLEVGNNFDKKVVKEWKSEHCSRRAMQASFETATVKYLSEVAPGAMDAFVKCVTETTNRGALSCSLNGDPAVFTAKWKRSEGEKLDATPVVENFTVVNGRCTRNIEKGEKVIEGGIGVSCTVQPKKDLLVVLETSRGVCEAKIEAPKSVYTVNGTLNMTSNRTITADEIELVNNPKIVTNGYSLVMVADTLNIKSKGEVKGFVNPAKSKAGSSGISGGSLIIKAKRIIGSDLTIDLSGQDGVSGIAGKDGVAGKNGRNARGRGIKGVEGCVTGHSSKPGTAGTDGKSGTAGGNGGNGGSLLIELSSKYYHNSLSRLAIIEKDGATLPGEGGKGGAAGKGGAGGKGGKSSRGSDGCEGRSGSADGPKGKDGEPGADGNTGKPGSITLLKV